MRALHRKLWRDLVNMKGQMAAVAVVMACGLMVMIMARGLVRSLESARDAYYASHRLAHVFCDLKRAPNALRPRLRQISGINVLETRVKGTVILELPGRDKPADGLVLSIPTFGNTGLNRLHVLSGRLPEAGSRKEVVVSEAFAAAHGFQPGHVLTATLRGARIPLRIVGTALSPEFVFETRPGETVPDSRGYGIFWMNERELAKALGLDGAFNNLAVTLAPGANLRAVKRDLDRLLAPYGALAALDRSEHPSAKLIDDRIAMLRGFSLAFPAIFLTIAAFMSSAALTRLVRLQREQIAQLKAFGYPPAAIGAHYFFFALAMVVAATLLGSTVGLWLGHTMVEVYRRFFQFPNLIFEPDWHSLGLALASSAGTSFLGVFGAVRQAMFLPPAEAMRPEPPARFSASLPESLGLAGFLGTTQRMIVRNVERKPLQSLFTTLGLALATAIPVIPGAMRDGIDYLMDFQWRLAWREDVSVTLHEPASPSALQALARLPGVLHAEEFRSVSAQIVNGPRERRIALIGMPMDAHLHRLLDDRGLPVSLPAVGLLVSEKLAEILDLRPGDPVRLEIREGTRPVLMAVLAGTITDFSGMGAYMDIGALTRLLGEDRTITGARLRLDTASTRQFLARVQDVPAIASTVFVQSARDNFLLTMGDMLYIMQAVYFGFAVIVSCGVVYNGARIALSERARELATLRVLGFNHGETAALLLGELFLLTLVALPPGLYIGGKLAWLLIVTASTESVRMPLVLTPATYATAALVVLASTAFSFAVVAMRLRHLDLLDVVKGRE